MTAFVANSHCVADRIERHYGRPSVVIPPPVDTDFPSPTSDPEDFYLVVSELVSYKRNDLAVEAMNRLRQPLVVIGTGPQLAGCRPFSNHRIMFRRGRKRWTCFIHRLQTTGHVV